jgi:predicted amidophosphoribosyltransferase
MRWNLAVGLLAGAFLGPFAFLLFLVSGIVSKSEQRVPCPQCAETIKREAKICPRCQSQVASAHT